MATASNAPTGKKIGNTTIGATAGATAGSQVGFALADVVVEIFTSFGVNLTAVENSLGVIISAALAILAGLLAGKLIPTNQVRQSDPIVIPIPDTDNVSPGRVFPEPGNTVTEETGEQEFGFDSIVTEVTVDVPAQER